MSDPTCGTPLAPPLTPLRAAYIDFRRRTFRQSTRGIPTPEQSRAWADDADALIATHDRKVAARAWDEGYMATGGRGHHEREATNPYREGDKP